MQTGDRQKRLANIYFILLLLVTTTALLSWFNLNSYFIILTLGCLLVTERRSARLRAFFSNAIFLGYFSLALIEAIGLLYTDNLKEGWHNLESKASLVALPFIMLVGPYRGKDNFKKIMTAYCIVVFLLSLICLGIAAYKYSESRQVDLFFYHDLVSPLKQNAISFTLFLIAGMLYLLNNNLYFGRAVGPHRGWRIALIIYYIGYSVLLASKLLLFVLPVILIVWLLQRYPAKKRAKPVLAVLVVIAAGATLLVATDNPVKARYVDILRGDMDLVKQDQFSPNMYLNGVQLRLLEYRLAGELLREHNAWVLGVGPGDTQDLLDAKYRKMNLYIGAPGSKDVGFLNYNSHNQFLQQLLQSGIIGMLALIVVCIMLLARAVKERSRETILFLIPLILVFITESLLELQHGLFLFTFFPLLFMYNLNNQHKTVEAP